VLSLFFSAWRVGEVRTPQWRDYDRSEQTIRLRPEHSKNKHGRVLPLVGELATILERRWTLRRLDCPHIFHHDGKPIGDFRKSWKRACEAIGLPNRIVHDLGRSGVRHLINAGIDPHTAMAFLRASDKLDASWLPHHRAGRSSRGGRTSQYLQRAAGPGRSAREDRRTRRERAE
jgi:integrase